MRVFWTVYRFIQILSLDIVGGALACTWMLASYLQVNLAWQVYSILGLAVFSIYTLDHLLDVRGPYLAATSARHLFFQYYKKTLRLLLLASLLVAIYLVFDLPLRMIRWGGFVMMLTGLYLYTINRWKTLAGRSKELTAALIYGVGIFTGPVAQGIDGYSLILLILFVQLVGLALLNLLLFSYMEIEIDEAADYPSLMRTLGTAYGIGIMGLVSVLVLGLLLVSSIVYAADASFLKVQLTMGLMWLTLTLLYLRPSQFKAGNRYRLIGDLIFFYPLLYHLL